MIGRCNLHLIQYPSRVKIGQIPSIANKFMGESPNTQTDSQNTEMDSQNTQTDSQSTEMDIQNMKMDIQNAIDRLETLEMWKLDVE